MATHMLTVEAGEGGADARAFAGDLGAAVGRWLNVNPITSGTSVVVEVPEGRL